MRTANEGFVEFDNVNLLPVMFPVEMQEIDGIPPEKFKKIVRTDIEPPDNFMGMAGSRYKPISHKEAFVHALDGLSKQKLDFTDAKARLDVFGRGEMAKIEVDFPAHSRTIGDNVIIHPKYIARNSLNGVWRYQSFFGWLNNVCFNTLVSGEKLAYQTSRHTTHFNIENANDRLKTAAKLITEPNSETLQSYRSWWHSRISDDGARMILKNSLAKSAANDDQVSDGVSDQNTKQLTLLMDKFRHEATHIRGQGDYGRKGAEGTLWDLFQAATSWSTHLEDVEKEHNKPKTQARREHEVRKMITSKRWREMEIAA